MGFHDVGTGPLLDALPKKVREDVVKNARRRTYREGDVVVREGDSVLHLFIVESGEARIVHGDGSEAAAGAARELGRFRAGDFFGEVALLEGTPRTATVIADEGLTVLQIPAWEFKALLEEHPTLAFPMLHKLIVRVNGGR